MKPIKSYTPTTTLVIILSFVMAFSSCSPGKQLASLLSGGAIKQPNLLLLVNKPNTAQEITSFTFKSADNTALTTDVAGIINGTTISLTVPFATDVTGLIAAFSSTGESVSVEGMAQFSEVTPNDFTNPVTYTVVANNGATQNYTVSVSIALNTSKEITAFSFKSADNPELTADVIGVINATAISLTVPYGTDVTVLKASFSSTGQSIKVGNIDQVSGITANDFTNPVVYTVTAADSSTQNYTVTVTIALNTAKNITAFSFRSVDNPGLTADVIGVINGTTITLTVPYGTDVTGLKAMFSTSGRSVLVEGVTQVSGTTANDFTYPVVYRVTADDGSTLDYTVTVNISPSSSKNITAFSFRSVDNPGLTADVIGTINGVDISLTVPYGTNVTVLKAMFSTSGQSVLVEGVTQVSEVTANDFTNPVTYRVVAADTTTRDYIVTITIAVNTAKEITEFSFKSVDNPGLSADVEGVIAGADISVTVPYEIGRAHV
jgi:trimeric autotransporter adhesin